MNTTWGQRLDAEAILPEYPRPQLRRDSYFCLNGRWRYAISAGEKMPLKMEGDILVPFSPESSLSGVNRRLEADRTLWYRREFTLPHGFNQGRVLLHFGAVDQNATVYLNGRELGGHTGGYTPFTLDITPALQTQNLLTVKVKDDTDASSHTRGKQASKPGGIWYGSQSGIWQTVWLESVPKDYITGLFIRPLYDEEAVELTVCAKRNGLPCTARVGDVVSEGVTNMPFQISMQGFTPWSPERPHLYDLIIKMGLDQVQSYFGMRKFSMEKDDAGIPRLFLNGKPYFHNGVLDQGYWPDGLYTPPGDEAMIHDIQTMKALGFNMLRKHVKVEPLRWYYHCDRLGMLVWQDMPNGGGAYKPRVTVAPLFLGHHKKDDDYLAFARESTQGRADYRQELGEMVANLFNCVCIAMWVPFNEGWGQFDAVEVAQRIRHWDGSRTIDHASGWHDQGAGDVKSVHVYFRPYRFRPDRLGRAVVLSEFGGYGLMIEEHAMGGRRFCYKSCKTREVFWNAWRKLYERHILPAMEKGLSAAVYTQLSDVETETNGLLTYDRALCKLPQQETKAINDKLRF
ncbi:MAG: glycoside hydrolase family 2 TIM barrel-domain containing protein [Candidatus Pelethousia sp.]|nr:glycoside hydrolase family 2 TIM barrel-domain containing protein [Candidatus Pelethousia sp.]